MRQDPEPARRKILTVCNVDIMAWVLLRPWLTGLQEAGYEVHIACAPGEYFERLGGEGFHMHAVGIRRSFVPWVHVRPVLELWRLLREGGFCAVNAHSAVAAALGRVAGWLAGCRALIYTVHGFYFHDDMPALPRWLWMTVEWLLGRTTDGFMFVSDEDRRTAARTGIAGGKSRTVTISNGVDLDVFTPRETCPEAALALRRSHGIGEAVPVIGIVGRIVREKGHREFLEMARKVIERRRAVFLVVGDTLKSDRDQFGAVFRKKVEQAGLTPHFVFTGHTEGVADYLRIMDIFVLPSYREGFPRSVVEAMSSGLPVVATDIRGCREAVVAGQTGLIVPPRDGQALGDAVERLLANPAEAAAMGRRGRERALELYDYRVVQRRFVAFVDAVLGETGASGADKPLAGIAAGLARSNRDRAEEAR